MKRVISKIALATALFFTLGISSSFANTTDNGNDEATISFHKDFKKAEVLGKEEHKNFVKFTFKMNDVVMFAFYNENGQLLAITRNIKSNQLPLQLLMDLKKDYSNCWITDLFEYNSENSSTYYVTLECADTRVTLRSNGSESWEVYNKKTKE